MNVKDITIANEYGLFVDHRGNDGRSHYWARVVDGSREVQRILNHPRNNLEELGVLEKKAKQIANRVYRHIAETSDDGKPWTVLDNKGGTNTYFYRANGGYMIHSNDMVLEFHIPQ